jgi:hypothetical protein
MRTVESVGATRATFARTARNAGDVPTISEFYRVAFRRKLYTTLVGRVRARDSSSY